VYLDKSASQWLIDNHVWTLAIDYLSIGSFDGGETVHKMLLKNGNTVVLFKR
jgi:arylformamidase